MKIIFEVSLPPIIQRFLLDCIVDNKAPTPPTWTANGNIVYPLDCQDARVSEAVEVMLEAYCKQTPTCDVQQLSLFPKY